MNVCPLILGEMSHQLLQVNTLSLSWKIAPLTLKSMEVMIILPQLLI